MNIVENIRLKRPYFNLRGDYNNINRRDLLKSAGAALSSLVFSRFDVEAERQLLSPEEEPSFRDTNDAIIFVAQWISDVSSAGYSVDGDESTYGNAWNNSSDEMRNLIVYPPAEARIKEIGNVVKLDDGRFNVTARINGLWNEPNIESTLTFIVSKRDARTFQLDWSEPISSRFDVEAERQLLSPEEEPSFRDTNDAIIFVAQWISDVSSAGYSVDGDESTYGNAWNNSSDEMRNLIVYPPAEARIKEIGNVVKLDDGRFNVTARINGLWNEPNIESTLTFIVSKRDARTFQLDWSEPLVQ